MVACDCGYEVKTLYKGKCWVCWQTGIVRLGDESSHSETLSSSDSVIRLAFLHPEREDVAEARRFFPRLLRGAYEMVDVAMNDGSESSMTLFEVASYPNYEELCEVGGRSTAIVKSLRHLNPDWNMDEEDMRWRLTCSAVCKSCGKFDNADCEKCVDRCRGSTREGKRCPNPRKKNGRGKSFKRVCGLHHRYHG